MHELLQEATGLLDDLKPRLAQELVERYLKEGRPEPADHALALDLLGRACERQVRFSEAVEHFQQAQGLYEELGNERSSAECQARRAVLLIRTQQLREGLFLCETMLNLARERRWPEVEALALEARAEARYRTGDYRKAVEDLLQAEGIQTDLGLDDDVARMSSNLALIYLEMGEADLAQPFLDRAAAFSSRQDDALVQARAFLNQAVSAWLKQETQLARELLQRVYHIGFKTANLRVLASAQTNLGMIDLTCGEYRSAHKYLLKGWQNAVECGDNNIVTATLTALGITLVFLNDPAQALHYATLSAKNVTQPDDIEALLLDYYLAIINLANDNVEIARVGWHHRQPLPRSAHLNIEHTWMRGMLKHIQSMEFLAENPLSAEAVELAVRWGGELRELRLEATD